MLYAYEVEGSAVPENEVDGALDVAAVEVVAALVVVERVLRAVEVDVEEGAVISADPQCHGLPPDRTTGGSRRCVLHNKRTYIHTYIHTYMSKMVLL